MRLKQVLKKGLKILRHDMLGIFLSNRFKSSHAHNLIFKFPLEKVYEILFWDFFSFFV